MSDQQEPVGSVAEEAAKLLGALQDWAKDSGVTQAGPFGPAGAAAEGLAARLREADAHVAGGGQDCAYCPLCQVIHKVRETDPEVKAHLAAAARSLLQAAAGLLETPVPPSEQDRRGVQRIDLDEA